MEPQQASKYVLYARKSSESDERQALSIDSQVKEMLAIAERDGLEIVDVRREAHSAKDSGQRPVFQELIADIGRERFNAILTWAPDRLSRNAGDLGTLVDLMDQKREVSYPSSERGKCSLLGDLESNQDSQLQRLLSYH